jgi:glutathione synthase/RimK-type ligase-like ATP-grasp enzyme
MANLPHVHILYENPDWLPPLIEALGAEEFEHTELRVDDGLVGGQPDDGIYLNRMSPSAHTRGHARGVELMRETLAWLEAHGARVVNGSRAFELEMSKYRQYMALERWGIRTPKTVLAVGAERLVEAARSFEGRFITKHNRGGKGLGIELFDSADELAAHLEGDAAHLGPHEQVIIQRYIDSPNPYITRVELVGGRMLFAMQSSTEQGFQLCPSDVCQAQLDQDKPQQNKLAQAAAVCSTGDTSDKFQASPLSADDPLVAKYRALCAGEGIEIAGIEFVEDADGHRYTYDINGTTNYNQALGETIGVHGMREVARYLRHVVAPQL